MRATATIIAALDNSRPSRNAFKQAMVLAVSRRADLIAVAVTPRYEGTMNRWSIDDPEQALSAPFVSDLEDAARYAASLGLNVGTEHRVGVPSEEIVACAARESAALIVIGGSRRSQVQRLMLGRTTARIVAEAPCDVLIVPEGAEIQFTSITVGISGSAASLTAGRAALQLAEEYGGVIHALAAIDIPVDRSLRYGVMEEARLAARRNLSVYQHIAEQCGRHIRCDVLVSPVDQALVEHAEKTGSQLIVVGYPAGGKMGQVVPGSVVERVISRAACPVLAVREGTDQDDVLVRAG